MPVSLRSSVRCILGTFAILCLSDSGAAWAGGGGGEDLATVQAFLNDTICPAVGMSPCPKLPTITQLVLEIAALTNATPDDARTLVGIPPGVAVNAVNSPASPPVRLSALTPLAFISPASSGPALATPLSNPAANSFAYAVATNEKGPLLDTLQLNYDYLPRTNPNFINGQDIADFRLPLTVFDSNNASVRSVPTVLEVRGLSGPCAGGPPCYTADVVGNFTGLGSQTAKLSDIGLSFKLDFSNSPNSANQHAIFDLQLPLLVTMAADSAYFPEFNPTLAMTMFDAPGFASNLLSAGETIGFLPDAAFFQASFLNDIGNSAEISDYLAISTDGTTLISILLPAPEPSALSLLAAALAGLSLVILRQRRFTSHR